MITFSYKKLDTNPDVMYSDETVVTSGHQQPLPALANILDSYESGVVTVMGVE